MKKILSFIIALIITVTPLVGCGNAEISELSLDKDTITLSLFGETDLTVKSVNVSGITWENGSDDVVKMVEKSNSVKLIAIKAGTSVITVKGGDLSASCVVVVASTTQQLALSVNGYSELDLRQGGTCYIPAAVRFGGEEFDKAQVFYRSQDETVATVSETGVVQAVSVGETVVEVYAEYYGYVSNKCEIAVSVKNGPLFKTNAAFLSLYAIGAEDDPAIFPDTFDLDVAIIDGETVIKDVNYEVDNADVNVAIWENGSIKALGTGNTELTLSYNYNNEIYTAKVYVTVRNVPVVSLSLTEDSLILFDSAPKESYKSKSQLIAVGTLDGKTISASDIYWTVDSGEGVVTVNNKGVVKGVTAGKAVVSANYDFGGRTYSARCNVQVNTPLAYISSHEYYDRAGVYSTIYQGAKLAYDEITLTNDRNTPFVRLNYIPDKLPNANEPNDNSGISNKMLRMIYVTLKEIGNESNSVTVAIRISYDQALTLACIGARASTFPEFTEGSGGRNKKPFFGINNGSNTTTEAGFSIDEARGLSAMFSLYGKYLDDTSDRYTLGFAIEGTALYMHNNNTVTKIWDLDSDTRAYAEANSRPLKDSNAWGGFTSDKVKLTVHGDYWNLNDHFNVMLLEIAGHTATAADLAHLSIE